MHDIATGKSARKFHSPRNLYCKSLSLRKWSVQMGIEDNYAPICSVVCRSNKFNLVLEIVHENPKWIPGIIDLKHTILNGNFDQLKMANFTLFDCQVLHFYESMHLDF